MSIVLVVILGASAMAFFGCFLLGICRDQRHARKSVVEIIQLSEGSRSFKTGVRDRKLA
jgi:hypothetical protein